MLTLYGAQGGSATRNIGGEGGTTKKYVYLSKGTTLFICVGGQTGYNGGGAGCGLGALGDVDINYNGVGATHIATRMGTLQQLGDTSSLLAVAGGGGGSGDTHVEYALRGGDGGGVTGGTGIWFRNSLGGYNGGNPGTGGTQSDGGHMIERYDYVPYDINPDPTEQYQTYGSFGKGGDAGMIEENTLISGAGGGGGLYGGGGGGNWNGASPGGGGSGWIGTSTTSYGGIIYTNTTTNGGRTGNGSASIQFITS